MFICLVVLDADHEQASVKKEGVAADSAGSWTASDSIRQSGSPLSIMSVVKGSSDHYSSSTIVENLAFGFV